MFRILAFFYLYVKWVPLSKGVCIALFGTNHKVSTKMGCLILLSRIITQKSDFLLARRLSRTPKASRFLRASFWIMLLITARVVASSQRSEKFTLNDKIDCFFLNKSSENTYFSLRSRRPMKTYSMIIYRWFIQWRA